MIRSISVALACGVALLVPGSAVAQIEQSARAGVIDQPAILPARPLHAETYAAVPASEAAGRACRADALPAEPDVVDPRWQWRLRAYRHLDCVLTLIDSALQPAQTSASRGGENHPVPIARKDLERIRTLAWWARDAAARIGQ